MPPVNDSGYVLTVGPDADGKHFTVEPGDPYDLPAAEELSADGAPADEPDAKPDTAKKTATTTPKGDQAS